MDVETRFVVDLFDRFAGSSGVGSAVGGNAVSFWRELEAGHQAPNGSRDRCDDNGTDSIGDRVSGPAHDVAVVCRTLHVSCERRAG